MHLGLMFSSSMKEEREEMRLLHPGVPLLPWCRIGSQSVTGTWVQHGAMNLMCFQSGARSGKHLKVASLMKQDLVVLRP